MAEAAHLLLTDTGLELWQFITLCTISLFASFITATFGLGGGMLMLATMALFLTPGALIPVHGMVQLGSNLGRTALMFRYIIKAILPAFLTGAVLGTFIGGQMLVVLPSTILKGILGVFILYAIWVPKFRAHKPQGAERR